jgi:hypothetical protein
MLSHRVLSIASLTLTFVVFGCSSTSSGAAASADAGDAAPIDASSDDVVAQDGAPDGADGGGCMLDIPDASACEACEAKKCCNTASAERQKPGTWTNSALHVCAENSCAAECALAMPTCGGITPDPASCLAALDAMCCAQVTACGQSDECVAVIYLCIDDQGNDPAGQAFRKCAAQYPNGLELFNALNQCFGTVTCP